MIARGDTDIARLVPLGEAPKRELGFVEYTVPQSFEDPLPAEELTTWEDA